MQYRHGVDPINRHGVDTISIVFGGAVFSILEHQWGPAVFFFRKKSPPPVSFFDSAKNIRGGGLITFTMRIVVQCSCILHCIAITQ